MTGPDAIIATPAIPDPWVFDFRGLWQAKNDPWKGRWYFCIQCDEGSTIATGPRPPRIDGFECYFVGHTPTRTSYSYREVIR